MLCDEADPGSKPCALPGDSPFGFGGSWRSPQTGLSWMGARWYAPKLAQFLSSDPLGYIDAYDSYGYAAFDPINRWDPSGLASQSFSEPAPWERFSWYVWGAVHGLSPGPLPGLYDSPASAALQAQFDDGFRNGALAGMVGSAFVAKVGGGAASTLGATGPGCLATAGPSMGTGCLPMAASLVGVGVAGSGAYLGAVYADKLATVGPGAPTRMSRVDDGGAGGQNGPKGAVDLTGHRKAHILNRHRAGVGKPGKTEFPQGWSDEKILHSVSDSRSQLSCCRLWE